MKRSSPAGTVGLVVALLLLATGLAALRNSTHHAKAQTARGADPPALRAGETPAVEAASAASPRGGEAAPVAATAPSRTTATQPGRAEPAAVSDRAAAAGMVVAVDPETGEQGMPEREPFLEFTVEELQAFARLEAEGLVTVRHPDGSESIEHEGRFVDYSIVRIGKDGKPHFECVHGTHGVQSALRKGRPARSAQEEE